MWQELRRGLEAIGGEPCFSEDVSFDVGGYLRTNSLIELDDVRALGRHIYSGLKRGKALSPPAHGWLAAVLDGHEVHASFQRHCLGCLERTVHSKRGDRLQYYHRVVSVSLVTQDLRHKRP